jgi:hypothetical protein
MYFNYTPSAGQLRELLPDVAAHMEEDFVSGQLRSLGIVFIKRRVKREMVIEIPMTPHHLMRIRAVDVGPGGQKEFVTFVRVTQTRVGDKVTKPALRETIRAHVEIISTQDVDGFSTFSYTLHEDSMEDIIWSAIKGAHQTRNLTLMPLDKRLSRKQAPKNPDQGEIGGSSE